MNNIAVFLLLVALSISDALADIVTKCDDPKGWTYFVAGKYVSQNGAKWEEDGITNGSYLVTRDKDGKYDIIYTDISKKPTSSRENGGDVVVISKSNNHLILVIEYPEMNIETWYFRLNQNGQGEVTVSQARYGEAANINKHSLMRAVCSK